jgi:Holliday junction resolvase RusA-like endonuclease
LVELFASAQMGNVLPICKEPQPLRVPCYIYATATFTLIGEPKSTLHIYCASCRGGFSKVYMRPEGKNLKVAYQGEAKAQAAREGFNPLKGELEVSIRFYFCTQRRRDLDNMNKLVLDALTGFAWEDDSQIARLHLYREFDRACPALK